MVMGGPCKARCHSGRLPLGWCHCQACGETGVPLSVDDGECAKCIEKNAREQS